MPGDKLVLDQPLPEYDRFGVAIEDPRITAVAREVRRQMREGPLPEMRVWKAEEQEKKRRTAEEGLRRIAAAPKDAAEWETPQADPHKVLELGLGPIRPDSPEAQAVQAAPSGIRMPDPRWGRVMNEYHAEAPQQFTPSEIAARREAGTWGDREDARERMRAFDLQQKKINERGRILRSTYDALSATRDLKKEGAALQQEGEALEKEAAAWDPERGTQQQADAFNARLQSYQERQREYNDLLRPIDEEQRYLQAWQKYVTDGLTNAKALKALDPRERERMAIQLEADANEGAGWAGTGYTGTVKRFFTKMGGNIAGSGLRLLNLVGNVPNRAMGKTDYYSVFAELADRVDERLEMIDAEKPSAHKTSIFAEEDIPILGVKKWDLNPGFLHKMLDGTLYAGTLAAGGAAGGVRGMSALGMLASSEDYYREGIESGLKPQDAEIVALLLSGTEASIEALNLGPFVNSGARKSIMAGAVDAIKKGAAPKVAAKESFAKYVAGQVAAESGEEVFTTAAQSMVKKGAEMATGVDQDTELTLTGLAGDALMGGTIGFLMGATGRLSQRPLYKEGVAWAVQNADEFRQYVTQNIPKEEQGPILERFEVYEKVYRGLPAKMKSDARMTVAHAVAEKERLKKEQKETITDPTVTAVAGNPIEEQIAEQDRIIKEALGGETDERRDPRTAQAAKKSMDAVSTLRSDGATLSNDGEGVQPKGTEDFGEIPTSDSDTGVGGTSPVGGVEGSAKVDTQSDKTELVSVEATDSEGVSGKTKRTHQPTKEKDGSTAEHVGERPAEQPGAVEKVPDGQRVPERPPVPGAQAQAAPSPPTDAGAQAGVQDAGEVGAKPPTRRQVQAERKRVVDDAQNVSEQELGARGAAVRYLASGGRVSTESIIKELGLRDPRTGKTGAELRTKVWAHDRQSPSIERVAERIAESTGLDEMAVRNELIEALRGASGRNALIEELRSYLPATQEQMEADYYNRAVDEDAWSEAVATEEEARRAEEFHAEAEAEWASMTDEQKQDIFDTHDAATEALQADDARTTSGTQRDSTARTEEGARGDESRSRGSQERAAAEFAGRTQQLRDGVRKAQAALDKATGDFNARGQALFSEDDGSTAPGLFEGDTRQNTQGDFDRIATPLRAQVEAAKKALADHEAGGDAFMERRAEEIGGQTRVDKEQAQEPTRERDEIDDALDALDEDDLSLMAEEPTDGERITPEEEGTARTGPFGDIPYKQVVTDDDGAGSEALQRQGGEAPARSLFRRLRPGEKSWAERRFAAFKNIKLFSRNARIESVDDVAFLFRALENEATENMFIVYARPDGRFMVQHVSTGTEQETFADHKSAVTFSTRFGADRVWLVHNHPSGSLRSSNADRSIIGKLKYAMPEGVQVMDGIIINLDSGKYVLFNEHGDTDVPGYQYAGKGTHRVKPLRFSRNVLRQPTSSLTTINSPEAVSEFLTAQKRGVGEKGTIIVMDTQGRVMATTFSQHSLSEPRRLAEQITQDVSQFKGVGVILATNEQHPAMRQNVSSLKDVLGSAQIALMDVVVVAQDPGIIAYHRSADVDGMLNEPFNERRAILQEDGHQYRVQAAADALIRAGFTTPEAARAEVMRRGREQHADAIAKAVADRMRQQEEATSTDVAAKKQAYSPLRIPVSPKKGDVRNRSKVLKDLGNGLGRVILFAKPGSRRAAVGTYSPGSAAVKIKYAGDLDTTAHEIGHALDDMFGFTTQAMNNRAAEAEARGLSVHGSTPPKGYSNPSKYIAQEGIAEYIRALVVNPQRTRREYPELTALYDRSVDDNAKEVIEKFSDDIRAIAAAKGAEVVMSNVDFDPRDSTSLLSRWFPKGDEVSMSWVDKAEANWLDPLRALTKAIEYAKDVKGSGELQPSKDPYLLARLLLHSAGKTSEVLESGMIDARNQVIKDADGNAKNLQWLLAPLDSTTAQTLEQDAKDVTAYMIAERTTELAKRFGRENVLTGIGAGIFSDVEVAQRTLDELRQDPDKMARMEEAAKRYREMATHVLEYLRDKGRLSKEQFDQIQQNNLQYVALQRVTESGPDQKVEVFKGSSGKLASVSKPIQSIYGSSRKIINPYIGLTDSINKSIKEADRNEVLQAFVDLLRSDRDMHEGEPIPLSRVGTIGKAGDPNSITVFTNGKPETWILEPDVYAALKGLDNEGYQVPYLAQVPAKIVRWTVTHFPVFAARNIVRDLQARTIISTEGSGTRDLVGNKEHWREVARAGGLNAGYYLKDDVHYYGLLNEAMSQLAKDKRFILADPQRLTNLWKNYENLLYKSETVNRVAEYRAAFRKAKKEGMSDYDAQLYAAFRSSDLIDFVLAGHHARVANQVIPFFNAMLQGLRSAYKHGQRDPKGFIARMALYGVLPNVALWMLARAMGDDDEYEQLPAWQRDMFYNLKIGDNKWLSIPKPFELGLPGAFVERLLSYVDGNEKAFDGYAGSVVKSFFPEASAITGPGKSVVEVMTNYDFFREKPIIPQYERNLALELRKTEDASRLGQMFQKAVGMDARMADHLIMSQFTYFGKMAIKLSDIGREDSRHQFDLSDLGFFRGSPAYNSVAVTEVNKMANEYGLTSSSEYKAFRKTADRYFKAKTDKEKDAWAKELIEHAKKLKDVMKKKAPKKKQGGQASSSSRPASQERP